MSFKDTFIDVGQRELDKDKFNKQLVASVGGIVTGLMVLAGICYWFSPVTAIIPLVLAIVAMAGRQLLLSQVRKDFADLTRAAEAMAAGQQPEECAEFIRLRTAQMLADNKMLTPLAKAELARFAELAENR